MLLDLTAVALRASVHGQSGLLKHQLVISSRARRRAPNLNSFDRFLQGLGSLFVPQSRIPKLAAILKPRTLFRFHGALKKCKYRWLFSSGGHRRPGPKGPSKELIDAIVEFKRRNPRVGCPRIAQEIAHAFGIDINKDIVRRVLAIHYRPEATIAAICSRCLSQRNYEFAAHRFARPQYYFSFSNVLASLRTASMKSCASGLSVRFLSVIMPVGRGIPGIPRSKILRCKCLPR